ncbi:transposase [Flavobacterium sp. CBA20B-1]|uniref:transposase n=1 Tax=unclassified Flavobacterium TaxID=196869 RepID=UPI0022257AE2|nr:MULTISPECIES: transposase [unclassified Flavobacterium]WCM42990.1 transposase [Flavobacterium sp. CBA20B-1]
MKKCLLLITLFLGLNIYAQKECDAFKLENATLTTENQYIKKILDINKPIVEVEKDNLLFQITDIKGNAKDKNIQITFLVATKTEYLSLYLKDFSIIDLEGNEYKVDFIKSSSANTELSQNVPLKLTFSFNDIKNKPLFLKLLKFKAVSKTKKYAVNGFNSNFEFRDLKVRWN